MGKPLWTFEGFRTDGGNSVVQKWYWDELTIDERDDIRDRIAYLGMIEKIYGENHTSNGLMKLGRYGRKHPEALYGFTATVRKRRMFLCF